MASSHRDEISRLELLHAAHPDGLVFPHLADAYRRAGRFDQAENLLNAGLRRHAEYSSAHVVLGRLRLDQGNQREAEAAFRRVLQLDPQNQVAIEYLAEIAAGQGRIDEALSLFRRLSRLENDDALLDRVKTLEQQLASAGAGGTNGHARWDRAEGNGGGRQAASSSTSTSTSTSTSGPSVVAPEESEDAAEVPEPGEVVTETMAELYARQGLYRQAAVVYRQLLERSPEDARLRAKLARIEAEQETAADPPPAEAPAPAAQGATAPLFTEPVPAAPAPAKPTPPPPAAKPPESQAPAVSAAPVTPAASSAPLAPATSVTATSIRAELRALLDWSPAPAQPIAGQRAESATEAEPVSPGTLPAAPDPGRVRASSAERELVEGSAPEAKPAAVAGQGGVAEVVNVAEVADVVGAGERAASSDALASAPVQTRSLIALTDMLVGLLEYRDPFFRGSSSLTRLLATSVAEEMGLSTEEQIDLSLAAVLRDLGRLALGGKLLPNARLAPSQEARRKIERHVDLALHLMEGIELPRGVRSAVRHHHERWDGAGYPDALATERIPLLARILAVVDSFAAMVSPRPYRLPRKVPEAAAELQQEAGTRYDPEVVNALVRVLARREQPHLGFVQRHHILLVNPDQPGAVVSAAKLCSAGYLAEVAVDPATARERLRRVPVAALVVSAESGAEETAALIREMRVDPLFSALPIVVVDAAGVALRVRLLESGADVCFAPGVRHAELQGTLGALVRRTLGPRREADGEAIPADSPWLALQGDVQDFPLTWLLQVMKYDSRTAAIAIRTRSSEGVIYLETGDAVHAQIRGGPSGEGALREMLQWEKGRFRVQPDTRPRERTITTSIMHLLLSQAVDEDHAAAGIFGAVSESG